MNGLLEFSTKNHGLNLICCMFYYIQVFRLIEMLFSGLPAILRHKNIGIIICYRSIGRYRYQMRPIRRNISGFFLQLSFRTIKCRFRSILIAILLTICTFNPSCRKLRGDFFNSLPKLTDTNIISFFIGCNDYRIIPSGYLYVDFLKSIH